MPTISPDHFARLLRRRSRTEFASFVADLWSVRGWSTTVEGDVVIATRESPTAKRQTLLVRHDAPRFRRVDWDTDRTDVTHVLASDAASDSSRDAAAALDADLLDRDDLYEMATYAVAPDDRDELFQRHFGQPATTARPSRALYGAIDRLGTGRGLLATVAIGLVLVAAVAAGASLLDGPASGAPGEGDLSGVTTPTPEPYVLGDSGSTVASETARPTSTPGLPTVDRRRTSGRPTAEVPWTFTPGSGDEAWRTLGGNPGRTGHVPSVHGPVREVGILASYEANGMIVSSPAVVDGTVYVGNTAGDLLALDALTLERSWRQHLGGPLLSSPAVVDGRVYVGSPPVAEQNAHAWLRSDQRLHALDAWNGTRRWDAFTGSITGSSPAVVDGTAFVGTESGRVYAVDLEVGKIDWNVSISNGSLRSPAVADGTVYVAGTDDSLYALDATDGSIEWHVPIPSVASSPSVANGSVYLGGRAGAVFRLDADTGSIEWIHDGDGAVYGSPAVANGTVYIGSEDGTVSAIDVDGGEELWAYRTDGEVVASPAVASETVYVPSTDGYVHALAARSGEVRWSFPIRGSGRSSVAVASGIVYATNTNGEVYALVARE